MTTPEEIAARREAFEDDDDNRRPDYPVAIKTIATAVCDLAAVERERDELRAEVERIKAFAERGIAAEATAVRQLEAIVARVEALHFRRPWSFLRDSLVFGQATHPDQCNHCHRDWPCETVAALEGGDDE